MTYIVVARDLLDVAVSWYHQISGASANMPAGKNGDEQPFKSSRQWVLDRIDEMGTYTHRMYSFEIMLKNLARAWELLAEPNVVLVHYEDLSTGLVGEMRRLARNLDISVPESKWPILVQAATFEEMQASAKDLQPWNPDVSKGQSPFFRRGSPSSRR